MILLSLASKQIWPHVLTVARLQPERLFLLHSEEAAESRLPAQRLKRFFQDSNMVPAGGIQLASISDSDFGAIESTLDDLQLRYQLPLNDCALNFTGGNKLMAVAAFRWSAKRGVNSFYLERRNQLTWFEPRDGDVVTRGETIDPAVTDNLDPVALLRCQLDASEVERNGESLVLNQAGHQLPVEELWDRLSHEVDPQKWLRQTGEADRESKKGDALEYASAVLLLKLGVKRVQRSLRLKVKSAPQVSSRKPHAEIDLLFVWKGRLWVVDCKDSRSPADLVTNFRRSLRHSLPPAGTELLARIEETLSIGQTKALKEDLLAVREAGGLLGQVVCIRKAELPEEVLQFARHNKIRVVMKSELFEGLKTLLFPDRPADLRDLAELASRFRK